MVSSIASRACISVPASLVTRRAELSSKSNTVAGALSPKIPGRLGVTSPAKMLLKVNVRVYIFLDREVQSSHSDALCFRFESFKRLPDERKKLRPPRTKSRRKMMKNEYFHFPFFFDEN